MTKHTGALCLVLGGTGYVGSAVCRLLHERGTRLAFTYHANADGARERAEEFRGGVPLRSDRVSYADTRGVVVRPPTCWAVLPRWFNARARRAIPLSIPPTTRTTTGSSCPFPRPSGTRCPTS